MTKICTSWLVLFLLIFSQNHIFSQDIWKEQGEIFTDNTVLPAGAVIQIIFEKPLVAALKTALEKKVTADTKSTKVQSDLIDFLPEFSVQTENQIKQDSAFSTTPEISGTIAARITSYDTKSRTYRISASHRISVGTAQETIIIGGIVNISDIRQKTVISSKIADVSIVFSGIQITRAQRAGQKDFAALNLESTTNGEKKPVELTPELKKKLFIDQFEVLLNTLFQE